MSSLRPQSAAPSVSPAGLVKTLIAKTLPTLRVSQVAPWVKNLPAKQQTQVTQVQSLGWEDPLEEEMATYSSILAWSIP